MPNNAINSTAKSAAPSSRRYRLPVMANVMQKRENIMRFLVLLVLLSSSISHAQGTDYWSKNKTMNMPAGVATTSCSFYNDLDQTDEQTVIMNELYRRWLKGWVSAFAMYSDWEVRDIEETEYLEFIQTYCAEFPSNTMGMAAHTFTYRIKR